MTDDEAISAAVRVGAVFYNDCEATGQLPGIGAKPWCAGPRVDYYTHCWYATKADAARAYLDAEK